MPNPRFRTMRRSPHCRRCDSLGKLADLRPTVIADTREQLVLPFYRLPCSSRNNTHRRLFVVGASETVHGGAQERPRIWSHAAPHRTATDLKTSFIAHAVSVRPASDCRHAGRDRAGALSFVAARQGRPAHAMRHSRPRYIPIVFIPTPEEAALKIEEWIYWFARQMVEEANTLCRDNGLTSSAPTS